MILDDITEARRYHQREHANELIDVLRHFLESHPEACRVPLRRREDLNAS